MNKLHVDTREKWRRWLEEHHATEENVWLVHYKKHTGKPILAYNDAVEEAICFGWIDGLVRKLDENQYAQKYTPRNPKSNWSDLNKKRAQKMIEQGLMKDIGLQKLGNALNEPSQKPISSIVPKDMKDALKADKIAWENFSAFAPSYRKYYIAWVVDAKRENTRKRRIEVVVERSRENKKPGM